MSAGAVVLLHRSDATFQEINSSTSKTGNSDPANQMRPDLQRDTVLPSEVGMVPVNHGDVSPFGMQC